MKFIQAIPAFCSLSIAIFASGASAQTACPSQVPDDVANAMRAMYDAAATGNDTALRARLAPNFYAFETGVRFDGTALPDMIAKMRASGTKYQWSVTQPDVQMKCDLAAIAYVNVGAVGDATGMKPVTWLESATLRFEDGLWRVLFLSSTRAPVAAQ